MLLLSCSTPPPPDPVARFRDDPDGAIAQVLALAEPAARDAAALRLIEAFPGQTEALCAGLDPGPVRERCARVHERPHLWTAATNSPRRRDPDADQRLLSEGLLDLWAEHPADPGACTGPEPRPCLTAAAAEAAAAGDLETAAARCLAAEDPRWQQECFFRTAEGLAPGPRQVQDGVDLCRGAGRYAPQCVGHLLLALDGDPVTRAQRIRAALPEADADRVVALMWCQYAHATAAEDPAALLHLWPDEGEPHRRSALALASMGADDPVLTYTIALESHGAPPPLVLPPDGRTERLLWHQDRPGEEAIPSIPFLHNGADRRPVSPNPTTDARLALLSALGHREPFLDDAVVQALSSDEVVIRWTAARILAQRAPEHPALAKAAQDPSPLVVGRSRPGLAERPPKRPRPQDPR